MCAAKFAQHFLTNRHAIERIADTLTLTKNDSVFEIGPGKGALTAYLVQVAGSVLAVDIDPEMIVFLQRKFAYAPNFKIIHSDILELDLNGLPEKNFKVAGNLPYNLTSPILRKLSEWTGWDNGVVMVQKEVGDRLVAKVGTADYGALTVGMNLTCSLEHVFDLSRTSFDPPPKVASTVVKITRRPVSLTADIANAQRVIQAAFQQRRKTIINSLSHGLDISKDEVRTVLGRLNIQETERPEKIDVHQFVKISEIIKSNK